MNTLLKSLCLWGFVGAGMTAPLHGQAPKALSAASLSASPETVMYPDYARKEAYLEVYRLHHRPDETVFDVTVYSQPGYWISLNAETHLVGCQTGKTYRLHRSEGFELNQQVVMPDSASRSFQLHFDPVDTCDQAVHWLETPKDTLASSLSVRNLPRPEGTFACRLKGRIVGEKPCRRLLMKDPLGNYRYNTLRSIPVYQQQFDYTFYATQPQVVELVKWEEYSQGAWFSHPFFVEEGANSFDLPDGTEALNVHSVTATNREWDAYQQQWRQVEQAGGLDSLYAVMHSLGKEKSLMPAARATLQQLDSVYQVMEKTDSPEAKALRNRLFELLDALERNGEMYTPAYQALERQIRAVSQSVEMKQYASIEQDTAPSLAGLYYLNRRIAQYVQRELPDYQQPYALYRKKYAASWGNHPLGKHIETLVASVQRMKVGSPYAACQAEDLQGKVVSVAERIQGKWAVIDLWASWCGPCRTNSRQLVSLYQRYRDRNFTIVGIAREQKISDVEAALRQEKFPWLQLVDLNDKYGIWLKHGIPHAAGGLFLIDPQGRIAAVEPTVDELEALLKKYLEP